MTYEQFKAIEDEQKAVIKAAKIKIDEAEKAHLATSDFKVGDRVSTSRGVGIVSGVSYSWGCKFQYHVNQIKKGGTMSSRTLRYYMQPEELTLIERAK